MSIHSLDPALIRCRAACLRCSGRGWLSHVDPLSRAIVSASSAMLDRGLLVFLDRYLAMLHVADARAVDSSCPLSLSHVVIWPCCMLLMPGPWTSRVHSRVALWSARPRRCLLDRGFAVHFCVLIVCVLVVVILLDHSRVPFFNSAMQSRSRTIMTMSILHNTRSWSVVSLVVAIAANVHSRHVSL